MGQKLVSSELAISTTTTTTNNMGSTEQPAQLTSSTDTVNQPAFVKCENGKHSVDSTHADSFPDIQITSSSTSTVRKEDCKMENSGLETTPTDVQWLNVDDSPPSTKTSSTEKSELALPDVDDEAVDISSSLDDSETQSLPVVKTSQDHEEEYDDKSDGDDFLIFQMKRILDTINGHKEADDGFYATETLIHVLLHGDDPAGEIGLRKKLRALILATDSSEDPGLISVRWDKSKKIIHLDGGVDRQRKWTDVMFTLREVNLSVILDRQGMVVYRGGDILTALNIHYKRARPIQW